LQHYRLFHLFQRAVESGVKATREACRNRRGDAQDHRARLLARRPEGIFAADFERGEIGPDLFRKACEFGLEGIVSKRSDRPYRAGRSKDWIKVKNRMHPAMDQVMDAFCVVTSSTL
jgi:ATP-dependent DNA ligase